MDKLSQIIESAKTLAASNIKAGNSSSSDAFENALSKAIDSEKSAAKGPGMENTAVNTLSEIPSADFNLESSADIVFSKTDRMLEMLSSYTSQLADPDVPLKNMAPVLEQINQTAGTLYKEAQNLSEKDAGLKSIANNAVITAQSEYQKFQRGDYLA